ncbi:MAG: hypothetical protein IJD06_09955 [Clostridia bacterium]|nr:hypothetical protein [Clostridia bacterium]
MHNGKLSFICIALLLVLFSVAGCEHGTVFSESTDETDSPQITAPEIEEDSEEDTEELQTLILPETGYYRPIDEAYPDPSHLPMTITYGDTMYTRHSYITDADCQKLEAKATYTYYSEPETVYEKKVIVYSVGEYPASTCIATNFDVFAPGTLLLYVNEAEWTEDLPE